MTVKEALRQGGLRPGDRIKNLNFWKEFGGNFGVALIKTNATVLTLHDMTLPEVTELFGLVKARVEASVKAPPPPAKLGLFERRLLNEALRIVSREMDVARRDRRVELRVRFGDPEHILLFPQVVDELKKLGLRVRQLKSSLDIRLK